MVQNAEDNDYPSGATPALEFVITSKDITCSGATATLLVFNNENGFTPANIESICRIGKSTKRGNRSSGYIGEKGTSICYFWQKLLNLNLSVCCFLSHSLLL